MTGQEREAHLRDAKREQLENQRTADRLFAQVKAISSRTIRLDKRRHGREVWVLHSLASSQAQQAKRDARSVRDYRETRVEAERRHQQAAASAALNGEELSRLRCHQALDELRATVSDAQRVLEELVEAHEARTASDG